jgi:hypothetical protein
MKDKQDQITRLAHGLRFNRRNKRLKYAAPRNGAPLSSLGNILRPEIPFVFGQRGCADDLGMARLA